MSPDSELRTPNFEPRPISEIVADLSRPLEPSDLGRLERQSKKSGKSTEFDFISWHTAVRYLDRYAPGWSNEITSVAEVKGAVVVVARLLIPCAEGLVWHEATGWDAGERDGYGDPAARAEARALKRAAAKFGLGRYLYQRKGGEVNAGDREQPRQKPAEPTARTVNDMATRSQVSLLERVAREQHLDLKHAVALEFGCNVEELSKRAASWLIDRLKAEVNPGTPAGEATERAAAAAESARLDEEILACCTWLGYNDTALRRWVGKRYQTTGGLDTISLAQKRDALAVLKAASRDQSAGMKEVS
jgi:hypothetical protein